MLRSRVLLNMFKANSQLINEVVAFNRVNVSKNYYSTASVELVNHLYSLIPHLGSLEKDSKKNANKVDLILDVIHKAKTTFDRVEDSLYYNCLEVGCDHFRKYEFEKAILCFDKVINELERNLENHLKPILAEAYTQKGLVLSKTGKVDNLAQCKVYMQKALKLNPNNELAKETLDVILFDKGKLPKSRIKPYNPKLKRG